MTRALISIVFALFTLFSPAALAAKPSVGWATGGLYTPAAKSGYLFTGPRLVNKVAERTFLVGGLSYEVAPASGRHGFLGTVLGEYMVSPKVGLDIFPALIQEWDSAGALSWYWGAGTGASLFLEKGTVLSPWASVSGPLGSQGYAWSLGLTMTQPL